MVGTRYIVYIVEESTEIDIKLILYFFKEGNLVDEEALGQCYTFVSRI